MPKALRTLTGAVALAAATVLAWWAWLGRDTEDQLDRDRRGTRARTRPPRSPAPC